MAGRRQIVDPPSFTPIPYGLLSTVEWPVTTDVHWQNGVTWQSICAVSGVGSSTYDECIAVTGVGGAPPPPNDLAADVEMQWRGATAFTVYTEFDCSPVGNAQAQIAAERALAMEEPWQVEYAFWTGLVDSQTVAFPHLAANAQVLDADGILIQSPAVTGAGAVVGDNTSVELQFGLLEAALANCYKGVGVIHVPQFVVPILDDKNIIRTVGPVMKTMNGNKVAVGAGYPGTGPDGSERGGNSVWMYATGSVFGYRSDVRVRAPQGAQALDRSTNTMKMIAERTYVLGWDCCHFAVTATLGDEGVVV